MFKKIEKIIKDQRGQIVSVETVILVAVVAVLVGFFGSGLTKVFVGSNPGEDIGENSGALGQLNSFIKVKFDAITTQ